MVSAGKLKEQTVYKKLHIQIEDQSGLPVYRQVMDQIQQYVVTGALESGDQLPSIRELASQIGVNPQTVVKAYGELEHSGILEMRRGRGAFLSDGARALAGIDYSRQLRERIHSLVREALQAGYHPEQLSDIFEEMIEEIGSSPSLREAGSEPDLKIIGGGSP